MDLDWAAVVRITLLAMAFIGVVLWLHESRKRMKRRGRHQKK